MLRLSSFDYEVSARVEVPAEVADAGTVLVSGRLLADISRSLPGKPVDVSTDGSRVSLTCGASRFTLLTMPVDEYPTLPAMPEGSGAIAGDVFTQAVAQVTVAASRDETLPILTGVRMEIEGERRHAAGHGPLPAGHAHPPLASRRPPAPAPSRWSGPAPSPRSPRRSAPPATSRSR